MNRKTESFMRGALMLTLAALVSRLLGAFYKPIIARIFAPFDGHAGAVGIGLTQVPLTTYQVILSFTSVGLNVGISRLVAERMALGDAKGAKRVFRVSLTLMAALGLSAGLVLWFGAPWIAGFFSKDLMETVPGFRATAPALVITSIMAAYRGLFQGFQEMTPNAVSQIVEQVVRVSAGVILTYIFVQRSVPLGAAGFNWGDVIGALAGLLYLLFLVRQAREHMWEIPPDAVVVPQSGQESPGKLVRKILAVAAPIAVAGAVVPLMMQADTLFVFRALAKVGMTGEDQQAQYGLLTNAFMIAYLPAVFTSAIYTSLLPAITRSMTLGQVDQARKKAVQAYRMTMLVAIPAQVGLYVLATAVYAFLFGDTTGGAVMAAISWAVVPIMLQQTTSGVLQGAGRIILPVRNFVIGAVVKAVLTYWLTVPFGIDGAAWSTAVGFAVAAILNIIQVERMLGRTLKTRSMILKPLAAALVMAGAIWAARVFLHVRGGHVGTLVLIVLGGAVYGVVILLVGGIKLQEIESIPKVGRPLAALLGRRRERG
jgi:stage V sporulation protein B